jgi:Zn-dependent metalloprotease
MAPLPSASLLALRQSQPQRANVIAQSLQTEKLSLGLGMLDNLSPFSQFTDEYGHTYVKCHQTYNGVEVFNSTVIGHMDNTGHILAPRATVHTGISLPSVGLLSTDLIKVATLKNLKPDAKIISLKINPVVFPSKYQDGIKLKTGADGKRSIDPFYSVATKRKTDRYRWAFRVSATQSGSGGLGSTEMVIDGLTGEVLKKWDGTEHLADTPAVSMATSQYSGTVPLNTTQLASTGQYVITDMTRPSQPWPDPAGTGYYAGVVGNQTLYWNSFPGTEDSPFAWNQFTNPTNVWGTGQPFVWATDFPANLTSPVAQTAAVDAGYNAQCTWDYYHNVHGRNGIDDLGGSIISIVHVDDGYGNAYYNADWNPSIFAMQYGDGGPTGSLTCLDVAGHEMSHGVMAYTANLLNEKLYESAALNEGNSDIHGVMVKHYFWGANGQGSVVPDTTTNAPGGNNTWQYLWTMGIQLSADGSTPMRYLYKPSLDGASYDYWFDGMYLDDQHYGMGATTHAFFFLAKGASATSTDVTYSSYLPGGMTGLGNDKAIHIWYHGMATKVTSTTANFHDIRDAMVASATELYPPTGSADSPETAAVKNAFAAINVGAPEGGTDPVLVKFNLSEETALESYDGITTNGQYIVPMLIPVTLPPPLVTNATDTSVTWSVGGLSPQWENGGYVANGKYVAPTYYNPNYYPVSATSVQDPSRYAVFLAYAFLFDGDDDGVVDACDAGAAALRYGNDLVYPAANFGDFISTGITVDDINAALFVQGFNNAFNQ